MSIHPQRTVSSSISHPSSVLEQDIQEAFSKIHPSKQDRVFYFLWKIKGEPPLRDYGKHAFFHTNFQSSSAAEKRKAIQLYQEEADKDQVAQAFSKLPDSVKNRVYFHMWAIKGKPSIPDFGSNAFHDSHGQSATRTEKLEAIKLAQEEALNTQVHEAFSKIPSADQDRVYFHLWMIKNKPSFDDYGRHAFHGTNGLSATHAEKLQAIKAYQEEVAKKAPKPLEKRTCSICLEELDDQDRTVEGRIQATACIHLFHKVCIETWLKNKEICPVCKTKQPPEVLSEIRQVFQRAVPPAAAREAERVPASAAAAPLDLRHLALDEEDDEEEELSPAEIAQQQRNATQAHIRELHRAGLIDINEFFRLMQDL